MTLLQGDCLERMGEIADGSVDMVLADPPYGTTACKWDSIIPLEPMWAHLKRIIKPNGAIVMTASQPFTTTLISSNRKMFKYCWVWIKNMGTGIGTANKRPMKYHEDICVFYDKQPVYNKQRTLRKSEQGKNVVVRGVRGSQSTVTNRTMSGRVPEVRYYDPETVNPRSYLGINCVPHGGGHRLHPTQKPVALMEYFIKTYTNEGETVLDFAMGSGTTGVACQNTGRHFIGIELDQNYFEIAEKRIAGARTLFPVGVA